jgi:hypothetical protein
MKDQLLGQVIALINAHAREADDQRQNAACRADAHDWEQRRIAIGRIRVDVERMMDSPPVRKRGVKSPGVAEYMGDECQ